MQALLLSFYFRCKILMAATVLLAFIIYLHSTLTAFCSLRIFRQHQRSGDLLLMNNWSHFGIFDCSLGQTLF